MSATEKPDTTSRDEERITEALPSSARGQVRGSAPGHEHYSDCSGDAGCADIGRMTSAVTGLYPWIGFKTSERVTVWPVAGYGAGGLPLDPGGGATIETGLSMAMAAGGDRDELITRKSTPYRRG